MTSTFKLSLFSRYSPLSPHLIIRIHYSPVILSSIFSPQALNITTHLLKRGGCFIAKIFRGTRCSFLFMLKMSECQGETRPCFMPNSNFFSPLSPSPNQNHRVTHQSVHPPRLQSLYVILPNPLLEAFVVCQDYCPPSDYVPTMVDPMLDQSYGDTVALTGSNRIVVPFVACGDLDGFDSDQSYSDVGEVRASNDFFFVFSLICSISSSDCST